MLQALVNILVCSMRFCTFCALQIRFRARPGQIVQTVLQKNYEGVCPFCCGFSNPQPLSLDLSDRLVILDDFSEGPSFSHHRVM